MWGSYRPTKEGNIVLVCCDVIAYLRRPLLIERQRKKSSVCPYCVYVEDGHHTTYMPKSSQIKLSTKKETYNLPDKYVLPKTKKLNWFVTGLKRQKVSLLGQGFKTRSLICRNIPSIMWVYWYTALHVFFFGASGKSGKIDDPKWKMEFPVQSVSRSFHAHPFS